MKNLFTLIVFVTASLTAFSAGPDGHERMKRHDKKDRHGIMFRLIESERSQLNLTGEQNVKLDKLLEDVKAFHESMMKERMKKRDTGANDFISDDFDPEKTMKNQKALREEKREKAQLFIASKLKELHSILTKEQREKLVQLAQEKKDQFKDRIRGKRH